MGGKIAMRKYIKLRRLVEDADLDQRTLANLAGLGESTLSKRLNGPADQWRGYEIMGICRAAGIPRERIGELFFPDLPQ